MELRSQAVRKLAPENDPLKIGMGWKVDDLSKPQIMVESTFGDSHPGSAHLDQFVKEAVQAVNTHGGKAARYFATDMCDGIAQGHDGINYSLPHRDAIVNLVEAQANATVYDGGVFIASCDKSMPAMLMSIGRLKDMSAIVVTGGVMEAHTLPKKYVVNDPACAINDLLTLEQIGKFDAWEKTGVIPNEQLDYYKHNACPSCGACSFMGTASTMQIMAEALGLMLPGTALMPATAPELKQAAYDAGVQVMKLVAEGIKAKDIVTMKSFENAIMVHAAISGSTNATMHLPAIAHEFGFEIDADTFDRMHRGAHYLLNIRPSGDWPAQYFYYAGGVPRVMEEIKSMLHLDVMTVTGKTLGETADDYFRMFRIAAECSLMLNGRGFSYERNNVDIVLTGKEAAAVANSVELDLCGYLEPEAEALLSSALDKFTGVPCTAIQTITCHGRDDYAVWNVEIPSDMFRSIVREAAEKVGTLEKLMSGMDPSSGCEMRLLTQMKDGRFAFFAIPERMNGLRDYETQGSSVRGSKEQIMAEIFTDWEPAEEPEDEMER